METIQLGNTDIAASRIGLGTWAIGGWMWGGSDEQQAIATIQSAIDRGITLIDMTKYMPEAIPGVGVLTKRQPTYPHPNTNP